MEVRLPQLAEGADTGTVVNLLVSVGDQLQKGQTILELENQKAVAPIPSPAPGKVKAIHVKAGDQVSVGHALITLEEEQASPGAAPQAEARPTPEQLAQTAAAAPATQPVAHAGAPPAAPPFLKKVARQIGLDLSAIRGSGHGGRITWEDVQAYIRSLQSGKRADVQAKEVSSSPSIDFARWGPVRREKLTPLRKSIAKAMEESWQTIPHVTQFHEADVTGVLELLKKHSPTYQKRGITLTLTVFLLKAVALLLKKHPAFNASLDEASGEMVYKEYVHLGIAVDTEGGLIVPVLRDADQKNLEAISKELASLAEKARHRKASLDDLQGASFTVSNQGGIGGGHFTPIIHKPEVAVLGVGRAVLRPVYRDAAKAPEIRWMLPLALSYDHRAIDGAQTARFIVGLEEMLKNFPESEAAQ